MSKKSIDRASFFNNYYEEHKLADAAVQEKINHLQDLLHVQVGVHFFAIDDNVTVDEVAEKNAILRALEREYLEMHEEQKMVFA